MKRWYAEIAPLLTSLGYDTTPVNGKRPVLKGWQDRMPNASVYERFPSHSIGVVCGGLHNIVAIDVDVLDPSCTSELQAMIEKELGSAPRRIGRPPKFLMPYRCTELFRKWKTPVFEIDGIDAAVEVLAEGQQFVAFGIHPDTKQPYDWPDKSIMDLPADQLTVLTPLKLQEFIEQTSSVLARYGAVKGRASGTKTSPQPTGLNSKALEADYEEVAAALDCIPNNDDHYDDWISNIHAIKGAVGEAGRELAHSWSAQSKKYNATETDTTWDSIRCVNNIGAGSLFHQAKEHGFDLGTFRHQQRSNAAGFSNRPPPLSDDDLAERFSQKYEHDLRYVAPWGQWLAWNGRHWAHDRTLEVSDLVRTSCREAARACEKPREAASVASAKTISAIERLAKADRRHAGTMECWDSAPWLLNTPDGTIDLCTGQMHDHDRSDLITLITPVSPSGNCPIWQDHLERVFGGDRSLIDFLQRVAGYSLTGLTREHALFFGYGTGANGKSVTINTLSGYMGKYQCTAPMETFTASNSDRHPTELAMLRGSRLVTSIETEEGRPWAESRIKSLTGGDTIAARFMRQDFFEYEPQFKLFVMGNHKPSLRNVNEAIRRRLHLIPFTVTIPPEQRDKDLAEKLREEWPGILAWAIEGATEWSAHGLQAPARVTEATEAYLNEEDGFLAWVDECCDLDLKCWEKASDLYQSWKVWAERTGESAGSQKRFSQTIVARDYSAERRRDGRGYYGLELKRRSYTDDRRYGG